MRHVKRNKTEISKSVPMDIRKTPFLFRILSICENILNIAKNTSEVRKLSASVLSFLIFQAFK